MKTLFLILLSLQLKAADTTKVMMCYTNSFLPVGDVQTIYNKHLMFLVEGYLVGDTSFLDNDKCALRPNTIVWFYKKITYDTISVYIYTSDSLSGRLRVTDRLHGPK